MLYLTRFKPRDSMKKSYEARVLVCGLGLILATALPAYALLSAQNPSTSIQQTDQSSSIHGIVIDANTNQPIARVLVQAGSRAVLTGHDGKFEFSNLTETTAQVKVTKPGYYDGLVPNESDPHLGQVGSVNELQIRLYPETLLTGTVAAANGDPLPQIPVQALRRIDGDFGSRWIYGGQVVTNADGQFRLPLPAGEYIVETLYAQARLGIHPAVLPTISPSSSQSGESGDSISTLHLISGSEQHLELHPPMRPSHAVHIQIDSAGTPSAEQIPAQIEARLANGLVFSPPQTRPAERPGEVVLELPVGGYIVSATSRGREGAASYGETKVTVADEDVFGQAIHMQSATELTIEASVDPAASSTQVDSVSGPNGSTALGQQLGLYLQRTHTGVTLDMESVTPTPRRGAPPSFSLLPGTYRLRTNAYSSWFVESASAGGTDLLAHDLVIDGGSSSLPLRIVASNQTATVNGTVSLAGTPSISNIYLIADAPSTSPVITVRSGQDGSFSRALIPPGNYRILASESRSFFDLTKPTTQARFASYMKTVTVGAGETGRVDLNAVPASEWKP